MDLDEIKALTDRITLATSLIKNIEIYGIEYLTFVLFLSIEDMNEFRQDLDIYIADFEAMEVEEVQLLKDLKDSITSKLN